MPIDPKQIEAWCRIPVDELVKHPDLKVPFRMVGDSNEMGQLMATEFIDLIEANNVAGKATRAIVPCGPSCWYKPWVKEINARKVSLKNLDVFHMDECLTWQGHLLPKSHPYNFRTFMEEHFYGGIDPDLAVPEDKQHWTQPDTMEDVKRSIAAAPIDICLGGWGQDGHVAYNQARRQPYTHVPLEELAKSTVRVQENNMDTILALAQRTFGAAYQLVPPMSITLGLSECLGAEKVRIFSDTGSWKQTALRVALLGELSDEYPMTLLQKHKDAIITATRETASHPVSEHPEWQLF